MKRLIAFSFPEYETAWLSKCVIGSFDSLDEIDDECKSAEGFEVLDTENGDIYDWNARAGRWYGDGNVGRSVEVMIDG